MSTRTQGDWILWGALGCTLVATAHAEYTLATATGLHWVVAGAVPGALDLYVIRALQKHRDVLPAVLVMVAANIASILVAQGVLPLHWGLYSAVGALAPLLLWRVHYLWRVQAKASTAAGAVSAPVLEASTPPGTDADWLPDFLADQVHPVLETSALPVMTEYTPYMCKCGVRVEGPVGELHECTGFDPVLPPLPPEYAPEYAAPEGVLSADDAVHLGSAHAYLAECTELKRKPSIRGLKEFGHMHQDRSKRLLTYLKVIT